MSEDLKTHIFEPFLKTKEPGKGTGLGLPTVLEIVQQSNGYITVYRERGNGENFSIYFPQHVGTGEVLQEVRQSACRGHGETILAVEDEDHVRDLAREVLETLWYKVLESKNGEDTLAIFLKKKAKNTW